MPDVNYVFCVIGDGEKIETSTADSKRTRAKFKVLGMSCTSCVNKIEKCIAGKTGVFLTMYTYMYMYVCT